MAWQSFGAQYMGTNRTMELLLYIIICLVLNDEVNSAFEVKKVLNPLSWETASHRCKDTRRNLNFAVPVVNLSSMTVLDEIGLQGDAWVGYFQTYEHFLFIVCVPLSEIESSVSAKFIIGSLDNRPGMCYSLCGLQRYIGLQDDVCYCIETRTFSTPDIQSVNSSCEDPLRCVTNGMLCGNREYNKISVYQKVSISSNDRIRGDGSGCLILTKRREFEISVANCSDRFQHLCESNTGLNQYLEESPTNEQWVHSIRDCPKTGKKPTTFIGDRTKFVFPTNDGSWWTSVVRDLVIRNFSESMTITGTPLYEGFLRNSNDGIKLEFVDAKKYSRKQFVACMSGNDNEASAREVKGTEKRTSSEEQASTLMSHSTHKTTIALVASDQPRNAQENRTNKPTENPITSATSEAPTMSRIPDESLERSSASPPSTEQPFPGCNSEPADVNIIYGLVGVSVMLLGALVVITYLVCVFRRRQISQELVQEFASHSMREQHALLERQITNPPIEPPRKICAKKGDLHSSYLTVIFDRERHDVAIQQPGCSHFD